MSQLLREACEILNIHYASTFAHEAVSRRLLLGGTGSAKGLYACILEKVEIWSGDTDASVTHTQTTEYSATQLA